MCIRDRFLSCVLNAENGYENTRSIQPAAQKKKIAVLGGGPALSLIHI